MGAKTDFIKLADHCLAYQRLRAPVGKRILRSLKNKGKAGVGVVFLTGYGSDMNGNKANFLAQRCKKAGYDYLRFDYRGHGQSSGDFKDCTIGEWLEDALTVFDQLTEGPQLLVGSSMGGWMALLLALKRPERIAGVVGIAAAPDFTKDLIWNDITEEQKITLVRDGMIYIGVAPDSRGIPVTLKLINEGNEKHLILNKPIPLDVPVHLIQGQLDSEVPWKHALKISERITSNDVQITFIKDGDHRLSRPEDLELIWDAVKKMAAAGTGAAP